MEICLSISQQKSAQLICIFLYFFVFENKCCADLTAFVLSVFN